VIGVRLHLTVLAFAPLMVANQASLAASDCNSEHGRRVPNEKRNTVREKMCADQCKE
jgi:hypothetical protein